LEQDAPQHLHQLTQALPHANDQPWSRRPGSRARSSGALAASMQREGAVRDSFVQNKMTRVSHLWTK
jgi:hypothetical protein